MKMAIAKTTKKHQDNRGLSFQPVFNRRNIAIILRDLGFEENSYGFIKRVKVFSEWIDRFCHARANILEVGCGTGLAVSHPLAMQGDFVSGIDEDAASVAYGRERIEISNLRLEVKPLAAIEKKFDVVICSEVLEHLQQPEEFLNELCLRVDKGGILIITVPNGFGPFELEKAFFNKIRHAWLGKFLAPMLKTPEYRIKDTLSGSPHIQFFTLKRLREMFKAANLDIVGFKNRTLFCGPLTRKLIGQNRVLCWLNNHLADFFPAWAASDWMFCLKKTGEG